MQKKISIIIIVIISALLLLPIISAAYSGLGFGSWYYSPLDFFESEWVMFALVLLVFFATIFYTLFKIFKNKAVAAIISGALAILITVAITERGLIETYGGGEISSWALFLAGAIGIAFLIKFASESFGPNGGKFATALVVFLVWLVLHNFYPEQLIPELLTRVPAFMWFYEFLIGPLGLIIGLGLALAFGGRGWTGWPRVPGWGPSRTPAPGWRDAWG